MSYPFLVSTQRLERSSIVRAVSQSSAMGLDPAWTSATVADLSYQQRTTLTTRMYESGSVALDYCAVSTI